MSATGGASCSQEIVVACGDPDAGREDPEGPLDWGEEDDFVWFL